jgi:hypothetical protein
LILRILISLKEIFSCNLGEVTNVINGRGIKRLAISADRLKLLRDTDSYQKLVRNINSYLF